MSFLCRVRRGYVECDVAMKGAAWLCRVRRGYAGCGVAMWIVRRAAVRQPRVRIPPGTPPLVQPRKVQEQKATVQIFPSAAAGDISAAAGVSARHQG
jgi:hypothetical protein